MSAPRRSARIKTGQLEIEPETPSVPDLDETPATAKHQQIGGKPKGNTQRAAPKAKLVARSIDPADVLAAGSDVGAESEPVSSSQSTPRKRGHPKGQSTGEDPAAQIVEPVNKKPKVVIQTVPERPRVKTRKRIPQRSPLPQRINRVVQPAKPVMPRPKRTSAAVAAAEAEKVDLLRRLEELDKQKKLALAEMELNEEEEDAEEERTAVRHLKDLPDSESEEPLAEPWDDVLEDFPMDEDEPLGPQDGKDGPLRLEGQCLELGVTKPTAKKKKKPAKGETRNAVEAVKVNLRLEREQTLKRPAENDGSKPHNKHLKETVTKPSGLRKNWQSKGISRGGGKGGASTLRDSSISSDDVLGGLADEDADSERPSAEVSKGRDVTRKNEIVHIIGSDSEVETTPNASRRVSRANVKAPSVKPTSHVKIPKRTIKSEESFDSHQIPPFVLADWATRFLPTLYHVLFCAEKPFHDFTKGSDLVDTVQQVLNIVHPNHSYVVTTESKLYLNAYDRLVEKRSDFGTRALHIVERVFKQTEFKDNLSAISMYAKWATGRDGPALWRVPSPQRVSHRDYDYVAPKDLFESQYMIDILTCLIKRPIEGSQLVEYGHPKGAVALAAAGIERAFSVFHSGQKVRATPFSRDGHGSIVADYMENLNAFSERRWKSLLTTCGVIDSKEERVHHPNSGANTSSLECTRHTLYIPSSP